MRVRNKQFEILCNTILSDFIADWWSELLAQILRDIIQSEFARENELLVNKD